MRWLLFVVVLAAGCGSAGVRREGQAPPTATAMALPSPSPTPLPTSIELGLAPADTSSSPPPGQACRVVFAPTIVSFVVTSGNCPDINDTTAGQFFEASCRWTAYSGCLRSYSCATSIGSLLVNLDMAATPLSGIATFGPNSLGCNSTYSVTFGN